MDDKTPKDKPEDHKYDIAGKPLKPTAQAQGHVLQSFEAAIKPLEPAQPKEDAQKTIQELHNEVPIAPLRTYESDVAEALKKKNASVVTIAVAEKKKEEVKEKVKDTPKAPIPAPHSAAVPQAPEPLPEPEEEPRRNWVPTISMTAISLLFIGVGLLVFIVLGVRYFTRPKAVPKAPEHLNIIVTESHQEITLDSSETLDHTLQSHTNLIVGKPNTLEEIDLTTKQSTTTTPVNAESFVTLLSKTAPSWLVRTFTSNYIFGYQFLDKPEPYIILKTNSYENAFAGMLKWEDTLQDDFSHLSLSPLVASSTLIQATNHFQDLVIKNKNVRAILDSHNQPILLYALPDKETIVITTNRTTLEELFTRLTTSQFTQ